MVKVGCGNCWKPGTKLELGVRGADLLLLSHLRVFFFFGVVNACLGNGKIILLKLF